VSNTAYNGIIEITVKTHLMVGISNTLMPLLGLLEIVWVSILYVDVCRNIKYNNNKD